MTDTKQTELQRDEKGRITGGTPPAGFNVNPQNRHNGAWKKESTPRFKLEQMMKLPEPDLRRIANNRDEPLFERKLAACIIKSDWKVIESMMSQVYGQPKQSVETTIKEPPKPLEDLTKGK